MSIYNRHDYKTAIPQLEKQMNDRFDSLLDFFYPVGCYFETSDIDFDPNKSWGGEWELETEGQVHVSAGTGYAVSGATSNTTDGGASTVTLTENEMPSHKHTQDGHSHNTNLWVVANRFGSGSRDASGAYSGYGNEVWTSSSTPAIHNTGGGKAHNNMQPYIIVNRWHRIK